MNERDDSPPQQILLIRHGEKPPAFGPPAGIKEDGREDHHSLIVRGWQRAGALVNFFCVPRDGTLRCPTRLYSPPHEGKDGDHGRPYQTLTAIETKLGVAIDSTFVLGEEPQLVADVMKRGGAVLVAWEHKRIPKIANAILGDETTAPQTWPDERFDVVWVFDREPNGTYRFSQRPQQLLGGDRDDVI